VSNFDRFGDEIGPTAPCQGLLFDGHPPVIRTPIVRPRAIR
jgi:hypothetical protein